MGEKREADCFVSAPTIVGVQRKGKRKGKKGKKGTERAGYGNGKLDWGLL